MEKRQTIINLDQAFSYWGPMPQNIQEVALFLPTVYLVSAIPADWLDGKRSPRAANIREAVQLPARA